MRRIFESDVVEDFEMNRRLEDDDLPADERRQILAKQMSRKLFAAIQRHNHEEILGALRDDCRERERRAGDPCTTAHYDAKTDRCVLRTVLTRSCMAERRRRRIRFV